MNMLFAVVTIGVVVAILGVTAWVFVFAPYVVPNRHPK